MAFCSFCFFALIFTAGFLKKYWDSWYTFHVASYYFSLQTLMIILKINGTVVNRAFPYNLVDNAFFPLRVTWNFTLNPFKHSSFNRQFNVNLQIQMHLISSVSFQIIYAGSWTTESHILNLALNFYLQVFLTEILNN